MKHLFISALLFCACLQTNAQQQQKFDPKVFQQRFESFTAEKAEFSKEESTKFFELYNEMKGKERALYRQYTEILRHTNSTECDDKAIAAKVATLNHLDAESAKLETEYYKKFRRIISDRKYFQFKKAEMLFNSRELRGRRHNDKNTK